ncbi:hypothetical protein M1425_1837 [Sulfolobus islandicus M.14.25]|uniref:Uncharacterized protein n=1 Tax=Saccharolobus islandicus (strain M.14.25 / Kamchatka \|nr:hypothetical protein M1425_1837 [Sulfolobus islandicus M.14.25]
MSQNLGKTDIFTQSYFSESKPKLAVLSKLLTLSQKLPKTPESKLTLKYYNILTIQNTIPPYTPTKTKSVDTLSTLFTLILTIPYTLFHTLSKVLVFTSLLTQFYLVLVKVSEVRENE